MFMFCSITLDVLYISRHIYVVIIVQGLHLKAETGVNAYQYQPHPFTNNRTIA